MFKILPECSTSYNPPVDLKSTQNSGLDPKAKGLKAIVLEASVCTYTYIYI